MELDYWDGGSSTPSPLPLPIHHYDYYQSKFPELSWTVINSIIVQNSTQPQDKICEILQRERAKNTSSSSDDLLSNQLLSLMGSPEVVKSAGSNQSVNKEYKTGKCSRDRCDDSRCQNYHTGLERRRNLVNFMYEREPCVNVFRNGIWLSPNLCMKGDFCVKAHSKNEIEFYDDSLNRGTSISNFKQTSNLVAQRLMTQIAGSTPQQPSDRNPLNKFIESPGPPQVPLPSRPQINTITPFSDSPQQFPKSLPVPPVHSQSFSTLLSTQPKLPGPVITNLPISQNVQITNPVLSKSDILSSLEQFLGKTFLQDLNSQKLEIALKLLKTKHEILSEEIRSVAQKSKALQKEHSSLLAVSSCPICNIINRDGVYACGHSVCIDCRRRMSLCPLCG